MRDERAQALASELRPLAEKEYSQVVLFGAILVVLHLLDIRPNEIEAVGMKVRLSDPIILQGAVSVLFLHKLYLSVINFRVMAALDKSFNVNRHVARWSIQRIRRPGRPIKSVKRRLKVNNFFLAVLTMPFVIALLLVVLLAFALAVYDLWQFLAYCGTKTIVATWLNDL